MQLVPQPAPGGQPHHFEDSGASPAPFLLYRGDQAAVEGYVGMAAEYSDDPGARRVLQIMHGLGASVTGEQLVEGVRKDIGRQVEDGVWPEIAKLAKETYLARLARLRAADESAC